jgi:hypothetical protein
MRHARALTALAAASVAAAALVAPSPDVVTMLFPAALLFLLASGSYLLGYGQGLNDRRTPPPGGTDSAEDENGSRGGTPNPDQPKRIP